MRMESITAFIFGLIIGSVLTTILNILIINKEAGHQKKTPLDILASKSAMRVFSSFIILVAYLLSLTRELSDASYRVPIELYGLLGSLFAFLFVIKAKSEN